MNPDNRRRSWLSTRRVARLLDCSDEKVRQLLQAGELRGDRFQPNGWWRIEYQSVVDFLARMRSCN